ncbi:MAG: YncE family protein [Opitutales bacterium]
MPFAHPFSVRRLLVPGAGFTRAVTLGAALLASAAATAQDAFRSPFAVELSPDASMLAVSDRTAKAIYLIDANSRELTAALPLAGEGMGLAWTPEGGLIVAEYDHGTLARINAATGEVVDRFTVAKKPVDVVVVGDALAVTEYGLGELLVLDRNSGAGRHPGPPAPPPGLGPAHPAT